MSNTMEQFNNVIKEINKLRSKEKLLAEQFEKSTDELSECFHYIIQAVLNGEGRCSLCKRVCPELYAKELEGIGFIVEELKDGKDKLAGYYISGWIQEDN